MEPLVPIESALGEAGFEFDTPPIVVIEPESDSSDQYQDGGDTFINNEVIYNVYVTPGDQEGDSLGTDIIVPESDLEPLEVTETTSPPLDVDTYVASVNFQTGILANLILCGAFLIFGFLLGVNIWKAN